MNDNIIPMSVANYKNIMSGESFYKTDKMLVRALGWEFTGFLTDLIERDNFFSSHNPNYDGWFYCEKWKRARDTAFDVKALQRLMKVAVDGGFVTAEMRVTGDNRKQWLKINYNAIYQITFSYLMIVKAENDEYSIDKTSRPCRQNQHTVQTESAYGIDKTSRPCRQNQIDINKTSNKTKKQETINKTIKPPTPLIDILSTRPKRQEIKYITLFPPNFQSDQSFKSIWGNFVEHRNELNKALTERAVKMMVTEILANMPSDIPTVIERIAYCIKSRTIGPYFKYWDKKPKKSIAHNFSVSNPKAFDLPFDEET